MAMERFALCRQGDSGYLVVEGPDDHLTTVSEHHRAWTFQSHESASCAARTIGRLTGCVIVVVRLT